MSDDAADQQADGRPTAPVVALGSTSVSEMKLSEVKLLTVAEVAQIMRVSKMSVYRLIHGGQLEAVRFGRSFRVTEKAVHAYLRGAYFETG